MDGLFYFAQMETTYKSRGAISEWAEDDRPREKLILKGAAQLSTAEILAILIGSGNKKQSALDLSRHILESYENNLRQFSRASVSDLTKFNGIGEAKAVSVVAALELARRCAAFHDTNVSFNTAKQVYELMGPLISALPREEFWALYLNNSNQLIRKVQLSSGGITGTTVDQRLMFKQGIDLLATGIIVCHNHPSGSLNPSQADLKLTKTLAESGRFLQLPVIDHLIVTDKGYFSFADEGLI